MGNPFTSGQAPAFNMLAPDIGVQQAQLARQQQMADILRQQALSAPEPTQVVSGWAVKQSPYAGLAKIAQALGGAYVQNKADEKQSALAKAMQERMSAAFDGMAGGSAPQGGEMPQSAPQAQPLPPDPAIPPNEGAIAGIPQGAPQPQQAPMAALPMSKIDQIRNQAKAAYLMGNNELANKLIENISTMTEGQRNDAYLGIGRNQAQQLELAKRLKEGTMSLQPGQTNVMPDGSRMVAPNFETGVAGGFDANGNPVAREIAGSTGIAAGRAGAISAAQEGTKLLPLGYVGQDGRPLGGTTAEYLGGGQAPAAPNQAPQPAPAPARVAPPTDLNHMTPAQSAQLMKQAEAQFGLRPGSTSGRSVLQSKAEADQEAADLKLRNDPVLKSATDIAAGDAGNFKEYKGGLIKAEKEGASQYQRNQQIRALIKDYQTGLAAPDARSAFASNLKNTFPNNAAVRKFAEKINGGDVGSGQELSNLLSAAGLTSVIRTLDGNGRVNKAEYEALQHHAETNRTDPDALLGIMDYQDHVYNQDHAELQAMAQAEKQRKLNPGTWNADYAAQRKESMQNQTLPSTPKEIGEQRRAGAAGQVARVTNAADYSKIPSGALYMTPDGQTRRRK